MVCRRMELGEPDESGRRRPVPIPDSDFEIDCTAIIAAISQNPKLDGLETLSDDGRWIDAEKETGATKIDNLYVGGDAFELGLVSIANYQGRRTADILHKKFRGIEESPKEKQEIVLSEKVMLSWYDEIKKNVREMVPVNDRFKDPDLEIQKGLSMEEAIAESKRCMSCGFCFDCGNCWSYCQDSAVNKPLFSHERYTFKLDFCTGCKKCAENCPCHYIEMKL